MLFETVRSGLVESRHLTSAIAVDAARTVLLSWGDPDREVFYRSAVKPFQATASLEAGAVLVPEQLAVACSSHSGSPIHLAYVAAILRGAGLDEEALQTPPAWPIGEEADARLRARGQTRPRRIFHNCSGKHSAWLAGCVAAGVPIATYLEPDHPVQRASRAIVAEVTGREPTPVGVDGCGAPTLRGSLRGLAHGFAALTTDERFRPVATAMARYPSLVAGSERADGRLAAWWPGPVKGGAEGLLAAARDGYGVAVKAEAGSAWVAAAAMMEAMRRLGALSPTAQDALDDVAGPAVYGGGRQVGRVAVRPAE